MSYNEISGILIILLIIIMLKLKREEEKRKRQDNYEQIKNAYKDALREHEKEKESK